MPRTHSEAIRKLGLKSWVIVGLWGVHSLGMQDAECPLLPVWLSVSGHPGPRVEKAWAVRSQHPPQSLTNSEVEQIVPPPLLPL